MMKSRATPIFETPREASCLRAQVSKSAYANLRHAHRLFSSAPSARSAFLALPAPHQLHPSRGSMDIAFVIRRLHVPRIRRSASALLSDLRNYVITTVILISARTGSEQLLNDRSIAASQLDKKTGSCSIR
jgi:hypothetical protein